MAARSVTATPPMTGPRRSSTGGGTAAGGACLVDPGTGTDRVAGAGTRREKSRRRVSVDASGLPVGGRPCLIWNHCSDDRVRGPKMPSTGPGS